MLCHPPRHAGLLQLGLLPYTWSKAAIQSLAAGLQGELAGSGISVTVICPGVVMSALSEKVGWPAAVAVAVQLMAMHGPGLIAAQSRCQGPVTLE